MSRIGRNPVAIPTGVQVTITPENEITVKGPKGTITKKFHPVISFETVGDHITVKRPDDIAANRALHGLSRALLANMVHGVVQGFVKELQIEGVGFRSEMAGKNILLTLGFSHNILFTPPEGIQISLANKQGTEIQISGIDKELVGDCASKIRSFKKPEPYKGKGIRYKGEYVPRKAGKYAK
jgi:large subunit ribosomal protein L6